MSQRLQIAHMWESALNTVLVTGGSGFVGSHCILQLLGAGHRVRTTVRSLKREGDVCTMLKEGGADPGDRLSFIAADLESDAGWPEAVAGCDYVLHVASPIPPHAPKHEDELILPARRDASRAAHLARGGRQTRGADLLVRRDRPRPEAARNSVRRDRLDGLERRRRAALREIENRGRTGSLGFHRQRRRRPRALGRQSGRCVRPCAGARLFALDPDRAAPDGRRGLPGCPRLYFGVVDVRDVADLHIRAMTHPAAKGERFLAVAGDFMSILDIAKVLKPRMGRSAKRVPAWQLPNWLVRIAALRDPEVKQFLPELGKRKSATNEKARRLLGWAPRSNEESIIATAESLLRLGLLRDSPKKDAR